MCDNLKPDRNRCDVCRTINLAKSAKHPKPDMEMYDKCAQPKEPYCGPGKATALENWNQAGPSTETPLFPPSHGISVPRLVDSEAPQNPQETELPLTPTCIKVCTKEEYKLRQTKPVVPRLPHYVHGKLLYGVKAGILVGAVYFTYSQGVWGDQQDVTECMKRWAEYIRSINTRRPPAFDQCGKVIKKISVESSIIAPAYEIYKSCITTCFAGVVKIPMLIKCAYIDYLKALQKKYEEDMKERALRGK